MDIDLLRLKVGEFFNGQYILEEFLGEGAFSEVFLVKHVFLDDFRVMKILKEPLSDTFNINHIFHEVRIASPLKHENFISIHDAGIISTGGENNREFVYFIMEYVPSGDLNQYVSSFINSNKMPPIYWIFILIKQISYGLNILHSSNPPIVHGDLKPGNLLLSFNSEDHAVIKLTDFGFSKELFSENFILPIAGTWEYMAPECFHSKFYPSTDIYAVGVIAYLFLTLKFPFDVKSCELSQILEGKPWDCELIPPSKYNPEVSPMLDEIVMKCLSVNPIDRYANAHELFEALDNCMGSYDFDDETFVVSRDVIKAFRLAKYENKLSQSIEILKKYDMDMMFEQTISSGNLHSRNFSGILEFHESSDSRTIQIRDILEFEGPK